MLYYAEPTPATLGHALQLYTETGALLKEAGHCTRVSGVGAAACIYGGYAGHGTILAVSGHLILQMAVIAPIIKNPRDTVARIHTEEQLLARKVFARVPQARR